MRLDHIQVDCILHMPLVITAPAGAPAIERPMFDGYRDRVQALTDWEIDEAFDDDLLPAHELAMRRREAI